MRGDFSLVCSPSAHTIVVTGTGKWGETFHSFIHHSLSPLVLLTLCLVLHLVNKRARNILMQSRELKCILETYRRMELEEWVYYEWLNGWMTDSSGICMCTSQNAFQYIFSLSPSTSVWHVKGLNVFGLFMLSPFSFFAIFVSQFNAENIHRKRSINCDVEGAILN